MLDFVEVEIPHSSLSPFYTLYVYGNYITKEIYEKFTCFKFIQSSLLILYYTYPNHRRAYVVRFSNKGNTNLPGVSRPVNVLLSVFASKVDKLKKAISFISENFFSPFYLPDIFFFRLEIILQRKGKIDYEAIKNLCNEQKENKHE